jgi:EAL domain-containing protein (putative c-di-GMP-specific phosphodiesterase class I)
MEFMLPAAAGKRAVDVRRWFLSGQIVEGGTVQFVPIRHSPFRIGRRRDLELCLSKPLVSGLHAEINLRDGNLYVSDLGSKNGTFVNGQAILGELPLEAGDLLQVADIGLRVDFHVEGCDSITSIESCFDQAFALSRFDDMLSERAVVSFLQPIVPVQGGGAVGGGAVAFELLGRGRLFGLKTPQQMFTAATRLNRERELSVLLRDEGLQTARDLPAGIRFYVNTHPLELQDPPALVQSLKEVRLRNPERPITIEIHEAAVISSAAMRDFCQALADLNMQLAYDDFGAGQSRIAELSAVPPDVLKFDMVLVRDIHTAGPVRQRVLENLVRMAHDAGIAALAEGIEVEGEAEACRQIGFDLGQGFLFGEPSRPRACLQFLGEKPNSSGD